MFIFLISNIKQALTHMWPVRLEDKVKAMAVAEHLKIVYFPLLMMVKGTADAYQIHKELGVQLKLIQKAKCRHGLDVTITAKKIMVSKYKLW